MNNSGPIITLLTDFGEKDAFVGIMKGVILNIAPQTKLVDLSHLIPPQDVKQAAFILLTAASFYPEGTIHLIVVDPGVGSTRRPIAVKTSQATFVAPDNGVLSYVLAGGGYEAVELANPRYHLPEVSNTFHGRDIFSPAAAHLAQGVSLEKFGSRLPEIVTLKMPRLMVRKNQIEAEVLNVDHFGNIRTSIRILKWDKDATLSLRPIFGAKSEDVQVRQFSPTGVQIDIGQLRVDGISKTFSDVQPGELVAFVGSDGGLEIAINLGNAAREFNIKTGDPLALHYG